MAGIGFTAIDFETANSNRGSVCAVGLVKVRDGKIVDKASWLIKPPPGIDQFDPINIEIHGIREHDVVHAADWEMSIEGILQFACEDHLVAYDALYDASVMRTATEHLRLDLPAKDFYCAQELARAHLELPKHHLNDVLEALKLPAVHHHEPGTNALACANVVLTIAAMRQFASLAEIWGAPTASIGQRRQGRRVRAEAPDAEGDAPSGEAPSGEAPWGESTGEAPDAIVTPRPARSAEGQTAAEAPTAQEPAAWAEPEPLQAEPGPATGAAPRPETPPSPAPARPKDRQEAQSGAKPRAASGVALLAAGLLAAFFLSALTGLSIQSFAAGQIGTGAVELALAVAAAWGVWAAITAGWRRIWPAK
jgi:DNA polymerase III epsilon subunit-like protein